MCSAQYQYRSDFERQHLQLFVHVAVKKSCLACLGSRKVVFVLVCLPLLVSYTASSHRFVLLTGMLRGTITCPICPKTHRGLVCLLVASCDHITSWLCEFKTRDRPLEEVACIIIAARSRLHGRSDT